MVPVLAKNAVRIKCNFQSLMGIMAFGLKKGMEVSISAKGTDEKAAVDCISQFLTSNAECAM